MSNYFKGCKKGKVNVSLLSLGGGTTKKKKKGNDSVETFNDFKAKSDYYISFSELIFKVMKKTRSGEEPVINADFVKSKAGKCPVVEFHEKVTVNYIACVVNEHMKFEKLDKRGIKRIDDPASDSKRIYFIPISLLTALIPYDFSKRDNIGTELKDIPVFDYTGELEAFRSLNIFSLATEVFLSAGANCKMRNLHVLL